MLRKFKISIDGKEYLVEMEEIGGVPQPAPVAPQPTAPVATTETPAPAVAGKAGTVTGIHVTQGQIVNPGEPLITIN